MITRRRSFAGPGRGRPIPAPPLECHPLVAAERCIIRLLTADQHFRTKWIGTETRRTGQIEMASTARELERLAGRFAEILEATEEYRPVAD